MDPEIRALINEVRNLVSVMGKQLGIGGSDGPMGGGKPSLIDPYNVPISASDSKKMVEAFRDQTVATYHLEKTTKKQTDATLDHIKKIEQLSGVLKGVSDLVGIATKYGVTRSYEIMGGQGGVVARGALEREKDFGKTITSTIGAALFATGNPWAMAAGAGVYAVGGMLSPVIGRAFGRDASIEASSRQSVAQISQGGMVSYPEQQMMAFGAGRMRFAGTGMGARGFDSFRESMSRLGISGQQATELYGQAISVGGQRGLSRLDEGAVRLAAGAGIYGSTEQVLMGTLLGGRAGYGQGAIEAASRRTGMTMDVTGQAALATRMQTFLAGGAAGDRLFNMASRTDMARTGGIMSAAGAITGAASGMAGAAEGNEGSEMLLFQQFRAANPGATYMDFVEARRNGVNDPRWLKTVRSAANSFAGQGQYGRILGQALGVASTPMGVVGTAKMMNEAFTGKLGELSKVTGNAEVSPDYAQTLMTTFNNNLAQGAAYQKQYGVELLEVNKQIEKTIAMHKDYNDLIIQQTDVMNKYIVSTIGIFIERGSSNGGTYMGG